MRTALLRLIEVWNLGPEPAGRLRGLARIQISDAPHPARVRTLALVLGALLLGLGVILFFAANWDALSRETRFLIAQAAVVLPVAAAFLFPRVRNAALLAGFLAAGALLALIGQTYQTGADPWQLFAWWALLGLPWILAARSDLLRAPAAAVLSLAIWLWQDAHAGWQLWGSREQAGVLLLGAAAHLVPLAALLVWRNLSASPDAFRWSLRVAWVALLLNLGYVGLRGVVDDPLWLWPVAFAAGLAVAWALFRSRPFDLLPLAGAALLLDTLLVAILVRGVLEMDSDNAGGFLLIGLVSAGIVGGSVVLLMRAQAAVRSPDGRTES